MHVQDDVGHAPNSRLRDTTGCLYRCTGASRWSGKQAGLGGVGAKTVENPAALRARPRACVLFARMACGRSRSRCVCVGISRMGDPSGSCGCTLTVPLWRGTCTHAYDLHSSTDLSQGPGTFHIYPFFSNEEGKRDITAVCIHIDGRKRRVCHDAVDSFYFFLSAAKA